MAIAEQRNEFGGSVSLNIIVASGGVYVMASIYYDDLRARGHLVADGAGLVVAESGFELFDSVGVDVAGMVASRRAQARSCLDWTERRCHLAGSAGKGLLDALLSQRWLVPGHRPRSLRITDVGRTALRRAFAIPHHVL